MVRNVIPKTVFRMASLVLLLVAMMGPWFADSHPSTEANCRPPLVWLGEGRCACLVPLLDFEKGAPLGESELWLLSLPPALPALSTLLLFLTGERQWLWIFHLAAWGLVAVFSLFFFFVGNMYTWGDGLGSVVAVAALAGEIWFARPRSMDHRVLILVSAGLIVLSSRCTAASEEPLPTPTGSAAMPPISTDAPQYPYPATDAAAQSPAASHPVDTPSTTPIAPEEAFLALAEAGVTHNADWKPYTREFNGVLMALVPAGCFQMGSTGGNRAERPVHEVCFDEPFWIDVYEVTNEQYGSTGCPDFSSLPDQPYVCLDWNQACDYCQARGGRLPTDAEWEYAARGPDGLVYPWGNEFTQDNAVLLYNSGRHPAIAGSKAEGVSWIGAYDMIGNVWEWVNDWYSETYYETLGKRVVNPQGPAGGTSHGMRGSSFLYEKGDALRASFRDLVNPGLVDNGVRCARSYRQAQLNVSPTPDNTSSPAASQTQDNNAAYDIRSGLIRGILQQGAATGESLVYGVVRFAGQPIITYTDTPPRFWVRDEDKGSAVDAEVTYDALYGEYLYRLRPGTYGISANVVLGENYPTPGDYTSFTQVIVQEGQPTLIQDLALTRIIHLTSPFDNMEFWDAGFERLKPWDTPLLESKHVVFSWDAIPEASAYHLTITEIQLNPDKNLPWKNIQTHFDKTFTETSIEIDLPSSPEDHFYSAWLFATDQARNNVGMVMIRMKNGYGWDVRFRIP